MKSYLKIILVILIIYAGVGAYNQYFSHQHDLTAVSEEGNILYWTCSMHPDVKILPKDFENGSNSCPICHMDLMPVKEAIAPQKTDTNDHKMINTAMVKIDQIEAKRANIKTEKIEKLNLYKEIRTVGEVAYDPNLVVAQEEYLAALSSYEGTNKLFNNNFELLLASAKRKLRLLGMTSRQIKELAATKKVETNLILPEKLMWVYADIYEYEIPWLKLGQTVSIKTAIDPGKTYYGTIKAFVPVIKAKTRTLTARILVKNRDLKLTPQTYVDVMVRAKLAKTRVTALPKSAVLDTGTRKIVYMDHGEGEYMQKEVELGPVAYGISNGQKQKYYQVISGIKAGSNVVTNGNFLIDSQSQLGAAASAYGGSLGAEDDVQTKHKH
jgi:membrane fusion protein, copper/silver efflux system